MIIGLVDYGMGNLKSIESALYYLKVDKVLISNNFNDLILADKLVLPGVGSYVQAMNNIRSLNLDNYLKELVLLKGKPCIGICLGMQLLFSYSYEDGGCEGLSFIEGRFEKLKSKNLKIPHVGFNQVKTNSQSKLFKGIENNSDFYFCHSFRIIQNYKSDLNIAICDYGEQFIAAFEKNNIFGTQFHPELSQKNGLKILENFINYSCA